MIIEKRERSTVLFRKTEKNHEKYSSYRGKKRKDNTIRYFLWFFSVFLNSTVKPLLTRSLFSLTLFLSER